MADRELRLRLLIRRHEVPEVRLIWAVPSNGDYTIAKLVSQVNEVVPLEGGDWGLEDYAVELRSADGFTFECLHFQQVGRVLKEDDEVIIRSLSTDDIRSRRLSGRYQISSDGKHLVDGLAYGRPWLRPPRDRPSITLPARKRARITRDESEEDGEDGAHVRDQGDAPLLLEYHETSRPPTRRGKSVRIAADLDDEDDVGDADEDGEMDDDFLPNSDVENEDMDALDEEDLANELQDIQQDEAEWEASQMAGLENTTLHTEAERLHVPHAPLSPRPPPPVTLDLAALDKITTLRIAFPTAPVVLCEHFMSKYGRDMTKAYRKLSETHKPSMNLHETLNYEASVFSASPSRQILSRQHGGNPGLVHSPRDESPLVSVPGSACRKLYTSTRSISEPSSGDSTGSTGSASITKGDIKRSPVSRSTRSRKQENLDSSSSSSSGSDSSSSADSQGSVREESSSDSSSDSDDSDSDSSSDGAASAPKEHDSDSDSESDSISDADSDSDNDSDSDSGNNDTVVKHLIRPRAVRLDERHGNDNSDDSSEISSSESSSDSDSESSSDSDSEPEEITSKPVNLSLAQPPRNGSSNSVLPMPQSTGQAPVPPGKGKLSTRKRNERRRLAKSATSKDVNASPAAHSGNIHGEDGELQARKQALLNMMNSDTQGQQPEQLAADGKYYEEDAVDESLPEHGNQNMLEIEKATVSDHASGSASSQRRLKLNLGAGRRILFGALGLRNPKTKADEEKLRADLLKNVRKSPVPHSDDENRMQTTDGTDGAQVSEEEDPDAWRAKINYRAVECWDEGVELSEPPFPFVQRWDPQQQSSWAKSNGGGKRKRADHKTSQSYGETDAPTSSKRQRAEPSNEDNDASWISFAETGNEDTVLDYDDPPTEPISHMTHDSQISEVEDLPPVPKDLSALTALEPHQAKPGMVITWKHWQLSSQTNWQPQLSSVTAVVVKVEGEEFTQLRLLLAKRDRALDQTEKTYDEDTGERVYDRFEVPDMNDDDDDDGNEDDGYRDLNFNELMEPKIVQQPPSAPEANDTSNDSIVQATQYDDTDSTVVNLADGKVSISHADDAANGDSETNAGTKGEEIGNVTMTLQANESFRIAETDKQDSTSSAGERSTYSPSRQLEEMSASHQELGQSGQPHLTTLTDDQGSHASAQASASQCNELMDLDTTPKDAVTSGLPQSDEGSVQSGRQPDPDFGLDLQDETSASFEKTEDDSGPPGQDMEDETEIEASHQQQEFGTPSSVNSFPSLSEVWATAASSRLTQSPSKLGMNSTIKAEKAAALFDPEYEAEMKRIDELDDDVDNSLLSVKKQLFPNASQSIKSAPEWSVDKKTKKVVSTSKRTTSTFSIPPGSQVVALSSDSSSPVHDVEDDHLPEAIDDGHESGNLLKAAGPGQKKKSASQANRGKGRVMARGESLPAKSTRRVTRQASMPLSSQKAQGKKRVGRRAASSLFEI